MDRAGGKIAAILERAIIGGEFDARPPPPQRRRERGGGKKVSARAAGGDENAARRAHAALDGFASSAASGRLRVSAMRKPMPRPSASNDDPP